MHTFVFTIVNNIFVFFMHIFLIGLTLAALKGEFTNEALCQKQ